VPATAEDAAGAAEAAGDTGTSGAQQNGCMEKSGSAPAGAREVAPVAGEVEKSGTERVGAAGSQEDENEKGGEQDYRSYVCLCMTVGCRFSSSLSRMFK
jgi:hypothetical protein